MCFCFVCRKVFLLYYIYYSVLRKVLKKLNDISELSGLKCKQKLRGFPKDKISKSGFANFIKKTLKVIRKKNKVDL